MVVKVRLPGLLMAFVVANLVAHCFAQVRWIGYDACQLGRSLTQTQGECEAGTMIAWQNVTQANVPATQGVVFVPIAEARTVWAVVVGISDYYDNKIHDLGYPHKDAEDFYQWLVNNAGVAEPNVQVLIDGKASLAPVRESLNWLSRMAQPDDLVIFYFSGHGYQGTDLPPVDEKDGIDEYLVLYDTKYDAVEATALRDDELHVWVDQLLTHQIIVVLDIAFAGGFGDITHKAILIASATEDQVSVELPELEHGLFTHFLLQGLMGKADEDYDGKITIKELGTYVSQKVLSFESGQKPQVILPLNVPPFAGFTWEAFPSERTQLFVQPRTGDRIRFDASASRDPDGEIVKYEWDWESDGTCDEVTTDPVVEHTFDRAGTYQVTLRVTDDKGATATTTQTVVVVEKKPPVVDFAFSPPSPSILDTVQFIDRSTDPDGSITSWQWDFGNGTTSTERNPTHRYRKKGTFTVTLRVTDDDGLAAEAKKEIQVVNLPPKAFFAFEPGEPQAGQEVTFNASGSEDPDGEIVRYAWDFDGDGVADVEGAKVTWTFASEGFHVVSLTVTDNDGATDHTSLKVEVSSPPGSIEVHDQWAVVVGVGDYQDPGIRDLRFSEADAQALYEFLLDPEGGGFPEDHVRLLLGSEATQQAIRAAFGWLIEAAGEDDLVVFYFSGHGSYDTDFNGDEEDGFDEYLVPYDAKPDNLYGTAVRDDEIGDWLSSLASRCVLLVLDTCFSGGAMRTVRGFDNPARRAGPGNRVFTDLVGEGRLFLASSQEGEPSYEDEGLGHGVFTYFLLKGLGREGAPEADADGDGRVMVEELKAYLEQRVPTYVRDTLHERPQHPLLEGDLSLAKLAITGYGRKLLGEVTAFQGDYVVISLGSRQGVKPGDRFQVAHPIELPDGTVIWEVRAVIEVVYLLGPERSVCKVVKLVFPVEVKDLVRPVDERG